MKQDRARRWWPWFAVGWGAYIAWDIVDQTILQQQGMLGGYALDWAVAGVIGAMVALVISKQRVVQPAPLIDEQIGARQSVVASHIVEVTRSLHDTLADINQEAGNAMTLEDVDQQRALRRTILATHRAQSLLDELAGLVASPRNSAPPPAQEMIVQEHPSQG